MSTARQTWALGLSLLVVAYFSARADGPVNPTPQIDLSGYAKTADLTALQSTMMGAIPTPYTGVPLGPNGLGITANNNQFVPSNAAQRQGVMRTTLNTDASGNWSVTWANSFSFISSTPTVVVEAGNPGGTQPISCNWQTRSQTGATGKCWQANTALLNLSIVTSGLTLNIFSNPPATNTPISVIMAEPTQ